MGNSVDVRGGVGDVLAVLPTPDDLRDLAALEERVVAADSGRLKLEWRVLH